MDVLQYADERETGGEVCRRLPLLAWEWLRRALDHGSSSSAEVFLGEGATDGDTSFSS